MRVKIKDTASIIANVPKLLKLVWQISPICTILLSIVTILRGLTPICELWAGKLVVDSVIHAISLPTPGDEFTGILLLAALRLGLASGDYLLTTLDTLIKDFMKDRAAIHVNSLLLKKSVELDLTYYESSAFYDKMVRAQTDSGGRAIDIIESVYELICNFISISGILVLLVRLGWFVPLVVVLTTLPRLITAVKYSHSEYIMRIHMTPAGRRLGYFKELLTYGEYVKEIRLFGLGQHLIEKWRNLYEHFRKENRILATKITIADFFSNLFANCGYYACYAFALHRTIWKYITIGDMTMYTLSISRCQRIVAFVFYLIARIYEGTLSVSTFFEFLELRPNITVVSSPEPFPVSIEKGIEFRNVSFKYPDREDSVLREINLTIGAGETIALVGENGAGKTTLVKLLCRLYDPTTGSILIDGVDIKSFDPTELASNIGVIFQDYVKYCGSVGENIGLGNVDNHTDMTRIIESAKKSGAHEFIDKLPHKYDTILGKLFDDGTELSEGQWQKIALARAFMRDAQILILDEPTAALDAKTEYEVFRRFDKLVHGKTTLLISHRFSTVRMADRILVIENGRIVEDGSHDELMDLNGKYATMFNMQAEGYQNGRNDTV